MLHCIITMYSYNVMTLCYIIVCINTRHTGSQSCDNMFATATAHCNGKQQDDDDATERKPLTHFVINYSVNCYCCHNNNYYYHKYACMLPYKEIILLLWKLVSLVLMVIYKNTVPVTVVCTADGLVTNINCKVCGYLPKTTFSIVFN